MIPPKELRLGNLVLKLKKQGGCEYELSTGTLFVDGVEVTDDDFEPTVLLIDELREAIAFPAKVRPVGLSPELLRLCGFVSPGWSTQANIFEKCFCCELRGDELHIIDNDFTGLKPLLGLHQLQNIFYDLTGEELVDAYRLNSSLE